MNIRDIALRRIIDSRGNPTIEAEIRTKTGFGRAAAPAGAGRALALGRFFHWLAFGGGAEVLPEDGIPNEPLALSF